MKKSAILLCSDGWFSQAQSQIEMKVTAGTLYLLQTDKQWSLVQVYMTTEKIMMHWIDYKVHKICFLLVG